MPTYLVKKLIFDCSFEMVAVTGVIIVLIQEKIPKNLFFRKWNVKNVIMSIVQKPRISMQKPRISSKIRGFYHGDWKKWVTSGFKFAD